MAQFGREKLPTAGNRGLDPSTNSVRPDIGKTAEQGRQQGDAGNKAFNAGHNRAANNPQPGNSSYNPK